MLKITFFNEIFFSSEKCKQGKSFNGIWERRTPFGLFSLLSYTVYKSSICGNFARSYLVERHEFRLHFQSNVRLLSMQTSCCLLIWPNTSVKIMDFNGKYWFLKWIPSWKTVQTLLRWADVFAKSSLKRIFFALVVIARQQGFKGGFHVKFKSPFFNKIPNFCNFIDFWQNLCKQITKNRTWKPPFSAFADWPKNFWNVQISIEWTTGILDSGSSPPIILTLIPVNTVHPIHTFVGYCQYPIPCTYKKIRQHLGLK